LHLHGIFFFFTHLAEWWRIADLFC
jgi:hypothetical protein